MAMVERVSEKLDFSPAARKDAVVFVANTPEINAYTFSTGKMIRFVVLQGLIQSFNHSAEVLAKNAGESKTREQIAADALEAVIGHELGHIRGEHVLNQMMLVSVLQASIEEQIADMEQQARPETAEVVAALRASMKATLSEQLARAWHHSHSGSVKMSEPFHARLKQGDMGIDLFDASQKLSTFIRKRVKKDLLRSSSQSLFPLEAVEVPQANAASPEAINNMIEQIKAYLEKYGRSCEVTSDRLGQISTSTTAAENADLLLVGAASREAALKVAEEISIQVSEDPTLMEQLLNGTHPLPIYRIVQYRFFENDPIHKIYTTPYLKALHLYLAVTKYMEEVLQRSQDNNKLELPESFLIASTLGKYQTLETLLAQMIVEELWKDVVDFVSGSNTRGVETIEETLKYLGYREDRQRFVARSPLNAGIASRTGFPKGMFGMLAARLEALDSTAQQLNATTEVSQESTESGTEADATASLIVERVERIKRALALVLSYAPVSRVTQGRAMLSHELGGSGPRRKDNTKGTGPSAAKSPVDDAGAGGCKIVLGED